jgi:hypothetical protein
MEGFYASRGPRIGAGGVVAELSSREYLRRSNSEDAEAAIFQL